MFKTKEKISGWKRLFMSPWFLAFNFVLLGFVGWSYSREVAGGDDISRELSDLKRQADTLEAKNRDYEALLGKAGTSSFVERQARLSLGYQKPGEKEVYLTKGEGGSRSGSSSASSSGELSNPQKWWRYFFSE